MILRLFSTINLTCIWICGLLWTKKNFKGDFFGDALKFAAARMQSKDKINKEVLSELKKNYFDKKKFLFQSIHHL